MTKTALVMHPCILDNSESSMVPAAGVRNTISLVSTLVILNLSGCDTLGQIKVSYPKVFSRERLVDSRYAETQWLQEQLDKVQSSSFQGGMDRRVLDVLIASVETNVKYGPPVEGADQAPQTTTIRPDKPILRAADSAVPKEPPKASGMEETSAELTSIERFNDKLAYRNAVNAAKREIMLDDAHDILGATLYDLNFDVTLIPGENSRQFGLVKLELCEPDLDDTFWKRLYDGWVQSARDEINDTSIFVQSRALAGSLTEEDAVFTIWAANEAQIKQEAAREKAQSGQATDLASAQEQTYANVERFLLGQSESLPDGDRPELARLIAEAVRRYYEEPMHGLLILGNPERLPSRHSSGIFFKIPVDAVLCGSTTLKDRMTTVKSSDLLAAITTEPKEYAQNISDVAAARLMSDFLAAFSGSFAGKASVAGDLEHMRDTEIFLQAIRRQPLAVGFGDGRTTFGWVLGPKYAIEESWQGNPKPVFKHTPIRHATSASIIAPAWWPSVKIKVTEQWIDEDGESISRKSAEAGSRTSDMNVSLPTDLSMITQTLMHGADREGGRPRLRAFWQEGDDEEKYQLEANTAGELLIRGKHLWRNPQVFVGSQRADSVRILADLNALHATFAPVLPIAGAGDRDAVVDLTVVTSYGASTLRDAVVVHPPTSQIVTARLVTRVVSGTDPVRFEFDPPPPTAFANLQLQIRQADSLDSWEESKVEVMLAEGRAAIPRGLNQTSALLEFQLRIKMQPNGDWINVVVSEMQSLVYVMDEAELKLKLKPTELTFDADGKASDELRLVVKMNPPQLFDEVYPWLKASDSLDLSFGGKHSLAVQRDAHGLFVDKDKLARSGSWLAPTQDQKKTQQKKHSSLLLRSPNGETVEVDGTLTVK